MKHKKVIFVFFLTGILFLSFGIPVYRKYIISQFLPQNTIVLNSQAEIPESIPVFDRDNPQAKGVILSFKHWPLNQKEMELVLKKLTERGLKKKSEIPRFKVQVFEWPDWQKGLKAEKACQAVSDLSFLDYCEPDYLLGPARRIAPLPSPIPLPSPSLQQGDLRACNIVPSKLELLSTVTCGTITEPCVSGEAPLSDYWAQEMIGADLLKEELKKVPPPSKEYFIAVFDTPYKMHDIKVRNLISDKGSHSVLPEIEGKIRIRHTHMPSAYLMQSNYLLDQVEKKCQIIHNPHFIPPPRPSDPIRPPESPDPPPQSPEHPSSLERGLRE